MVFASSAAASALGSVLRTSIASVTTPALSALPQLRQCVTDGGGPLEALRRHPAEDLPTAGRHHAQPPARGQLDEPRVQLHLDVLGGDALEKQDAEVAHVGVGL